MLVATLGHTIAALAKVQKHASCTRLGGEGLDKFSLYHNVIQTEIVKQVNSQSQYQDLFHTHIARTSQFRGTVMEGGSEEPGIVLRNPRLEQGDVRLSKALSWLLRHGALNVGLEMDDAGFMSVSHILDTKRFRQFREEDIRRVVEQNEKQRFGITEDSDGNLRIRANQGHSGAVANRINPDKLLQRLNASNISVDSICLHGTTLAAWDSISQQGLSRMKRQMIHCAGGFPSEAGVISGMRKSCQVFIFIDIYTAISDGIPFFRSENNVLLTPGVGNTGMLPIRYFKRARCQHNDRDLLQEGNPSCS